MVADDEAMALVEFADGIGAQDAELDGGIIDIGLNGEAMEKMGADALALILGEEVKLAQVVVVPDNGDLNRADIDVVEHDDIGLAGLPVLVVDFELVGFIPAPSVGDIGTESGLFDLETEILVILPGGADGNMHGINHGVKKITCSMGWPCVNRSRTGRKAGRLR